MVSVEGARCQDSHALRLLRKFWHPQVRVQRHNLRVRVGHWSEISYQRQ